MDAELRRDEYFAYISRLCWFFHHRSFQQKTGQPVSTTIFQLPSSTFLLFPQFDGVEQTLQLAQGAVGVEVGQPNGDEGAVPAPLVGIEPRGRFRPAARSGLVSAEN